MTRAVRIAARRAGLSASLLSLALLASCRSLPATRAPDGTVSSTRPSCRDVAPSRSVVHVGVSSADSSVTQARVRWAVADLISALNARQIEDLAVRYDWTGNTNLRDDLLSRARGAGSATSVREDSSGTWFSDAPGRREQTICVSLDVHWNTLGGVPSTQRFALEISAVDDGRAAWLSRLRVNRVEE